MIYKLNGVVININQQQLIGGVNWAAGDLLKNQDKWAALGITAETDPIPPPPTAAEIAAALAASILGATHQIDADVDQIYQDAVGNRTTEYQLARDQALAYQSAGYTGTVPVTVQHWATLNAQTATWAADNILAQANAWAGAQLAIRDNRLSSKAQAKAVADAAALSTVLAGWAGFVAYIRGALQI